MPEQSWGLKALLAGVPTGHMTKEITLPNGGTFRFKMSALTLGERDKIRKASGDDTTEFALRLLVKKALNPETMEPAFSEWDLPELRSGIVGDRRIPANVIDDLVTELVKTEFDEEEPPTPKSSQPTSGKTTS